VSSSDNKNPYTSHATRRPRWKAIPLPTL